MFRLVAKSGMLNCSWRKVTCTHWRSGSGCVCAITGNLEMKPLDLHSKGGSSHRQLCLLCSKSQWQYGRGFVVVFGFFQIILANKIPGFEYCSGEVYP